MSERADKLSASEWADRLWQIADATTLDFEHRQLASALVESIADDPEHAAHLIAVLCQMNP